MVQYEKIEGSEPRQIESKTKAIHLPFQLLCPVKLDSDEGFDWQLDNYHLCDLSVNAEDKVVARELAIRLQHLLEQDRNHPDSKGVIDQLMSLRAKPAAEYTAQDTWEAGAFAMSCYCGGTTTAAVISLLDCHTGLVLEALCGHDSYFEPNPSRQIIALDGCRKSLLRYPHLEAEKFCCDLDQVAEGKKLEFLVADSFDLISVCFGYKYPRVIEPILREFFRLLKPGGTISFVESKTHGYTKYTKREFEGPDQLMLELTEAGFINPSAVKIVVKRVKDSQEVEINTGVFQIKASKSI